jgi:hypothetical protein
MNEKAPPEEAGPVIPHTATARRDGADLSVAFVACAVHRNEKTPHEAGPVT